VFLDESGVRTGMKRLYGRSAPGFRIIDHAPAGRWETHTVTAAIRTTGVAAAIRDVGAKLLYLPPYSPDFNPIEMAWSKMKTLIRSKAPTTFRRLIHAVGKALAQVSTNDCRNYLKACRKLAMATQEPL